MMEYSIRSIVPLCNTFIPPANLPLMIWNLSSFWKFVIHDSALALITDHRSQILDCSGLSLSKSLWAAQWWPITCIRNCSDLSAYKWESIYRSGPLLWSHFRMSCSNYLHPQLWKSDWTRKRRIEITCRTYINKAF